MHPTPKDAVNLWTAGFATSAVIQGLGLRWFARMAKWGYNDGWQREIAIWNIGTLTLIAALRRGDAEAPASDEIRQSSPTPGSLSPRHVKQARMLDQGAISLPSTFLREHRSFCRRPTPASQRPGSWRRGIVVLWLVVLSGGKSRLPGSVPACRTLYEVLASRLGPRLGRRRPAPVCRKSELCLYFVAHRRSLGGHFVGR